MNVQSVTSWIEYDTPRYGRALSFAKCCARRSRAQYFSNSERDQYLGVSCEKIHPILSFLCFENLTEMIETQNLILKNNSEIETQIMNSKILKLQSQNSEKKMKKNKGHKLTSMM